MSGPTASDERTTPKWGGMICASCGAPVEVREHRFFAGTPERPSSTWVLTAPLYFKASPDFRRVVKAFCGVACATSGAVAVGPLEGQE